MQLQKRIRFVLYWGPLAQAKMEDLNAYDEEMGARIIAGTARSMGLIVE